MRRYFPAAPWPTALKLVSTFGTVALLATAYGAYRAAPLAAGFTRNFGIGVALIPLAVLAGAAIFVVRGYTVIEGELYIERLLSVTRVELTGLRRAWSEPLACKGSFRLFGNGGLFAFTGWFYNKKLGNFRLFATDISRTVVLQLPKRVVVVSPADPQAFIAALRHEHPELEVSGMAEK
jgi:hypothetical protein